MAVATLIFLLTYLLIGLQRLPRLHLGRPAGAMLGAVAMVLCGVLDFETAKRAIDLDTLLFLLGMMIVLAYLELSGFFEILERRIMGYARSPRWLLLLVMGSSSLLSALFMNDTICLLFTPVVVRVTKRLELPTVPYLIGLAAAANIGSACTIVGNPQNALIAVRSGLGFLPFAARLWPVSLFGSAVAAGLLCWMYRRQITGAPLVVPPPREPQSPQRWMLVSSLLAGLGMTVALACGVPPAAAAMSAAAAVVIAGATRPRTALQKVDWSLLLLFGGLFIVMRGVEQAGLADEAVARVAGNLEGGDGRSLARLGVAVTLLSQAVSNVPAVMFFVPTLEAMDGPGGPLGALARALGVGGGGAGDLWLGLAAFSTLAGNLTIIGSVANVIVFETARRDGVEVGFREYFRVGLPVTLATLVLAWLVLLRG
ncbi:MAG TPA: SLC13 family permease [Candidatus Krumholzibacteria bacterium]|nr:SLC13 family permease [Candidatus Krumholzibacteria bacterium]